MLQQSRHPTPPPLIPPLSLPLVVSKTDTSNHRYSVQLNPLLSTRGYQNIPKQQQLHQAFRTSRASSNPRHNGSAAIETPYRIRSSNNNIVDSFQLIPPLMTPSTHADTSVSHPRKHSISSRTNRYGNTTAIATPMTQLIPTDYLQTPVALTPRVPSNGRNSQQLRKPRSISVQKKATNNTNEATKYSGIRALQYLGAYNDSKIGEVKITKENINHYLDTLVDPDASDARITLRHLILHFTECSSKFEQKHQQLRASLFDPQTTLNSSDLDTFKGTVDNHIIDLAESQECLNSVIVKYPNTTNLKRAQQLHEHLLVQLKNLLIFSDISHSVYQAIQHTFVSSLRKPKDNINTNNNQSIESSAENQIDNNNNIVGILSDSAFNMISSEQQHQQSSENHRLTDRQQFLNSLSESITQHINILSQCFDLILRLPSRNNNDITELSQLSKELKSILMYPSSTIPPQQIRFFQHTLHSINSEITSLSSKIKESANQMISMIAQHLLTSVHLNTTPDQLKSTITTITTQLTQLDQYLQQYLGTIFHTTTDLATISRFINCNTTRIEQCFTQFIESLNSTHQPMNKFVISHSTIETLDKAVYYAKEFVEIYERIMQDIEKLKVTIETIGTVASPQAISTQPQQVNDEQLKFERRTFHNNNIRRCKITSQSTSSSQNSDLYQPTPFPSENRKASSFMRKEHITIKTADIISLMHEQLQELTRSTESHLHQPTSTVSAAAAAAPALSSTHSVISQLTQSSTLHVTQPVFTFDSVNRNTRKQMNSTTIHLVPQNTTLAQPPPPPPQQQLTAIQSPHLSTQLQFLNDAYNIYSQSMTNNPTTSSSPSQPEPTVSLHCWPPPHIATFEHHSITEQILSIISMDLCTLTRQQQQIDLYQYQQTLINPLDNHLILPVTDDHTSLPQYDPMPIITIIQTVLSSTYNFSSPSFLVNTASQHASQPIICNLLCYLSTLSIEHILSTNRSLLTAEEQLTITTNGMIEGLPYSYNISLLLPQLHADLAALGELIPMTNNPNDSSPMAIYSNVLNKFNQIITRITDLTTFMQTLPTYIEFNPAVQIIQGILYSSHMEDVQDQCNSLFGHVKHCHQLLLITIDSLKNSSIILDIKLKNYMIEKLQQLIDCCQHLEDSPQDCKYFLYFLKRLSDYLVLKNDCVSILVEPIQNQPVYITQTTSTTSSSSMIQLKNAILRINSNAALQFKNLLHKLSPIISSSSGIHVFRASLSGSITLNASQLQSLPCKKLVYRIIDANTKRVIIESEVNSSISMIQLPSLFAANCLIQLICLDGSAESIVAERNTPFLLQFVDVEAFNSIEVQRQQHTQSNHFIKQTPKKSSSKKHQNNITFDLRDSTDSQSSQKKSQGKSSNQRYDSSGDEEVEEWIPQDDISSLGEKHRVWKKLELHHTTFRSTMKVIEEEDSPKHTNQFNQTVQFNRLSQQKQQSSMKKQQITEQIETEIDQLHDEPERPTVFLKSSSSQLSAAKIKGINQDFRQ